MAVNRHLLFLGIACPYYERKPWRTSRCYGSIDMARRIHWGRYRCNLWYHAMCIHYRHHVRSPYKVHAIDMTKRKETQNI